jgi:LemA protein
MPAMSATQWAVLAVAALLVFWMVGAYNRLVALRNAIGAAWAQIDAALRLRSEVVAPLAEALRGPLAHEQGALDALASTHLHAQQAALALGARPVAVAAAADWVMAEQQMASASSRVFALLEQHAEQAAAAGVGPLVDDWNGASRQLAFARKLFDAAAAEYNAAAGQRPTRWLLPFFGFGAAGLLG